MSGHGLVRATRTASALALGSVGGGLLAYAFFALVTRALGPVAAAPVAVLWAWWGFAGAALTFPIQHWISRSVALHGGERGLRRSVGALVAAVAATAVVTGLVAWLGREPLFGDDGWVFPALVSAVTLGSGLLGYVRGALTARRRFGAVGAGLVVENALRCGAAAALLVAGVDDPAAYGACLVVGYAAGVLWPSAFRLGEGGAPADRTSVLGSVAGLAVGQLLGQAVLTGGPVLLAVAGGMPRDVTVLFAGLALFRAPYMLALGLVAPVTARLTRLVADGRSGDLRRLRLLLVGGTLGVAAVAAVLGGLLGPWLMELVFGAGVRLDGELTLLLAVATTFALTNLVLTLLMLARHRTAALLRGWSAGLLPGAALFAWSGQELLARTCWAFLVVEVAVTAWLVLEDVLAARTSSSVGASGREEDR
jgi:O-antigen/teichoic acid export membrane protein